MLLSLLIVYFFKGNVDYEEKEIKQDQAKLRAEII